MATVIYARQSLDRHGDSLAVTRQLDLCRKLAAERGWKVTAEHVDNDRSATNGKERPEFEAVLASRPARIIVWHVDRLVRLTRDLERVIELGADVHAVQAGHLDLSNPAGRAVARTVTAWATYEGEQKADRQRASNDQRAASGIPAAGRRCYGYSPDGLTVVEAEAVHVRRAVESILSGTSLRAVTRALNAAGAVTTAGNPWKPTEVRRYLQRPRLAGQRVHRGEVVGPGCWPPIVSLGDHVAVNAILADPSRRLKGRPRAYLLSGIGRCGVCGDRLYGRGEKRGPIYVCASAAHLGRKIEPVDAYVEAVVVARLSLPDAAAAFTRTDQSDRAATLRAEQATLTDRLDGLVEAYADGTIDARQLTTGTARLRDRLNAVKAELPGLSSAPALGPLVAAEDVSATWATLDTETRREVVSLLAEVTMHRAGRGARTFDPETVEITWRQS